MSLGTPAVLVLGPLVTAFGLLTLSNFRGFTDYLVDSNNLYDKRFFFRVFGGLVSLTVGVGFLVAGTRMLL